MDYDQNVLKKLIEKIKNYYRVLIKAPSNGSSQTRPS